VLAAFFVEADKATASRMEYAAESGLSANASNLVHIYKSPDEMQSQGMYPTRLGILIPNDAVLVKINERSFLAGTKNLSQGVQIVPAGRIRSEKQPDPVSYQFQIRSAFNDCRVRFADVGNDHVDSDLLTVISDWSKRFPQDQFWSVSRCKFLAGKIKFVSSESDGIVSDSPQFFSGVPQAPCKGGENNCEKARDRLAMAVEKPNDSGQGPYLPLQFEMVERFRQDRRVSPWQALNFLLIRLAPVRIATAGTAILGCPRYPSSRVS